MTCWQRMRKQIRHGLALKTTRTICHQRHTRSWEKRNRNQHPQRPRKKNTARRRCIGRNRCRTTRDPRHLPILAKQNRKISVSRDQRASRSTNDQRRKRKRNMVNIVSENWSFSFDDFVFLSEGLQEIIKLARNLDFGAFININDFASEYSLVWSHFIRIYVAKFFIFLIVMM